MTVEDGCADTFDTGLPAHQYTFCRGKHAILNQLIRLMEGIEKLENVRRLDACCLSKYKNQLDNPKQIRL